MAPRQWRQVGVGQGGNGMILTVQVDEQDFHNTSGHMHLSMPDSLESWTRMKRAWKLAGWERHDWDSLVLFTLG